MTLFTDSDTVLRLATVLASGYVVVSSAEFLAARDRLRDGDVFSWKVARHRQAFANPLAARLAAVVLPYRRFLVLLAVRALLGLSAGAFALRGDLVPVFLGGVVVTTLAISFRHPYGLEGGFQMSFVVFTAVFVASLLPAGSVGREVAVLFVAAQSVLSYLVAGVAKLNSGVWRDGAALTGIFATSIYGHEWLHERLGAHPRLDTVGCWATIGFECLFPLVVVSPSEYVVGFLLLGVAFHTGTAIFMGLNGFLLPFVATYPALVYANHVVGRL